LLLLLLVLLLLLLRRTKLNSDGKPIVNGKDCHHPVCHCMAWSLQVEAEEATQQCSCDAHLQKR
jgi:hypothetical protein